MGKHTVLVAALVVFAAEACPAAEPEQRISHYGVSYGRHGDLDLVGLDVVVRTNAFADHDWLALDLSAPLEVYRFKDDGKVRFAADYLVGLGVMLPLMATSVLCRSCDCVVKPLALALLPAWAPLVHPALTAAPVGGVGVAVGYDAAYVFQAEDKGVAFNPYVGLRLEPARAFRIEGGVNHQNFWNWQRSSETFGWGWFTRAAVSTDVIGGAKTGRSYD
ncbi:hypothetical protein KKG45_10620 [bacterium]|nr:hypothetical protein [bacterium]MBU1073690.1 hypothetical protein [bacterium]